MRVCMVAYTFYESDPRVRQYANALIERGDTVDVIALRPIGAPKYETFEGVNLFRIQEREVNERGPLQYASRIIRFLLHASTTTGESCIYRTHTN